MAPIYGWGSTASRLEPLQKQKKERFCMHQMRKGGVKLMN